MFLVSLIGLVLPLVLCRALGLIHGLALVLVDILGLLVVNSLALPVIHDHALVLLHIFADIVVLCRAVLHSGLLIRTLPLALSHR